MLRNIHSNGTEKIEIKREKNKDKAKNKEKNKQFLMCFSLITKKKNRLKNFSLKNRFSGTLVIYINFMLTKVCVLVSLYREKRSLARLPLRSEHSLLRFSLR